MPFRPPPCLSASILRTPRYERSSARRSLFPPLPPSQHHNPLPHASSFHASARVHDSVPSHYDTLSLPSSASPQEIKRQFFTLSKRHHPDKNPDDPTASTRFVQISEAYHVLSVPEKRAQYDEELHASSRRSRWGRSNGYAEGAHPQGSYSSASFGARSASGLNKKRSTFRGPPPSFYNAGGYGAQSSKRNEYAHHQHPHANPESAAGAEAGQEGGFGPGFGPGQTGQGSHVPHFDDMRHKQTHDHVNEYIYARRRSRRRNDIPEDMDRGGMLINFLLVSGAVGMIGLSARVMSDRSDGTGKKKESSS